MVKERGTERKTERFCLPFLHISPPKPAGRPLSGLAHPPPVLDHESDFFPVPPSIARLSFSCGFTGRGFTGCWRVALLLPVVGRSVGRSVLEDL